MKFLFILFLWDAVFIITGLLYPFVADPEPLFTVMNVQLIVTILTALVVLGINLRKSLQAFPFNDDTVR